MTMLKTLGGDRLGAGKKMQVELHGYNRSTHDLGYLWRSTMASGTLVPFMSKVALPGDTWDINLMADVKTHPTIGPLFGSYKVQLDVFFTPARLYNSHLHNNSLGIGKGMSDMKIPQITMPSFKFDYNANIDLDNAQINPSSLLAYLGIRGVGIQTIGVVGDKINRYFNALPILIYWDTVKNYYTNKQEGNAWVIHTPRAAIVNTITTVKVSGTAIAAAPTNGSTPMTLGDLIEITFSGAQPDPAQVKVKLVQGGYATLAELGTGWYLDTATTLVGDYNYGTFGDATAINWAYVTVTDALPNVPVPTAFPNSNIDLMRKAILADWSTTPFYIETPALTPYTYLSGYNADKVLYALGSQEGLALKTYQSDLLNNWLKTENIAAITTGTAIDTTGGSFTIDQLNLSKKVYDLLNRINVSGNTYDDWLDAVWATDRYRKTESPVYMGGLSKELIFQEVVSNSQSADQPLGTIAGKGVMSGKHKGGKIVIKVEEPGYIMGIVSLTPRIDYSQGNSWDINLQTFDDFHKPALDQIGFQDLITEQMHWAETKWNGTKWATQSAGKQPAWINYMTDINKTYGNFAVKNNEMFMTLNRRYDLDSNFEITDLTTYIDPSKFNFIFAETALDAQNFWTQIAVDCTVRRVMSAKVMPNL